MAITVCFPGADEAIALIRAHYEKWQSKQGR
jgi:hypothetical protein